MSAVAVRLSRYVLTRHAVERFVQRVRPDLDFRSEEGFVRAWTEMRLWMEDAVERSEFPAWLVDRHPCVHLQVGDDAVVCFTQTRTRRIVRTVLTRDRAVG